MYSPLLPPPQPITPTVLCVLLNRYAGSPDLLPVLAPEMDKIADELMSMINTAGIRVGVTLRPQVVTHNPLWNASVPANKPPWRYYQRDLVLEADGKTPDEDAITANLLAKATYAIKRWNASVFYVDSTGHPFVAVWDALRKVLPNIIFIPEQSDWAMDYSTVTPLQDNWNGQPIGVNPMIKAIWPQACVRLLQPLSLNQPASVGMTHRHHSCHSSRALRRAIRFLHVPLDLRIVNHVAFCNPANYTSRFAQAAALTI